MRKIMIILAMALLAPGPLEGQGTVYLSNLNQASTGSEAVGSNSWVAAMFRTGNNAGGYDLNSIQLGMAGASGSPNSFMVMLYSSIGSTAILPGSSLGTFSGSTDPATSGAYSYSDISSIVLSPSSDYFIVLTDGTAVANGAYSWSLAGVNSYNPNGGWAVTGGVSSGVLDSNNGSSWNSLPRVYPEFAITATPIPEPSASLLFLLGSGIFLYVRRTLHR